MIKLIEKNINTPEYWNSIYDKEISNNKYRIESERFEKVTNMIQDGSVVLDVGCGTGEFVNFLHSKKEKCVITGIDFSNIAIEEAKKRNPKCIFFTQDAMEISKTFNDIDYVISFETLEHLSNPSSFINEIYKTLKKGGVLFLSMPYNNNVTGGDEHIYSFIFQDMVDYFEKSKIWTLIVIMRYSENLKNMMVITKKT